MMTHVDVDTAQGAEVTAVWASTPTSAWARWLALIPLVVLALCLTALPAQAGEIPFDPYTISDVDAGIYDVTVADLDRDGRPDIVAASYNLNALYVWWNNDGTAAGMTVSTITSTFSLPYAVDAADMDGDGDLDVIGCAYGEAGAYWWENDGTTATGAWTQHAILPGLASLLDVTAADVDSDGDADVLGASYDGDVVWWENDGTGTLSTMHTLSTTFENARDVVAADLDRDGDLDVVGASLNLKTVAWWENDGGDGTSWIYHVLDDSFVNPIELVVADLNGDGAPDVGITSNWETSLRWYENSGFGTGWATHDELQMPFNGRDVAAADMDFDGDLDLVTGVEWNLAWWENLDGAGTSWQEHSLQGYDSQSKISIAVADLDGEGDLDIVMATAPDAMLAMWENRTIHRDSRQEIQIEIEGGLANLAAMTTEDVDFDGNLDVVGAINGEALYWWDNDNGDGIGWTRLTVASAPNLIFYDVKTGDVDGDDDPDIVVSYEDTAAGTYHLAWYENDDLTITWTAHTFNVRTNTAVTAIELADLDAGDGDLDVVGVLPDLDEVAEWHNMQGDGSAWAYTGFLFGSLAGPNALDVADLDGDGDLDWLVAYAGSDEVVWWETGTSIQAHVIDTYPSPSAIQAVDINGDGALDILAGSDDTNEGCKVQTWINMVGDGSQWASDCPLYSSQLDISGVRGVDMNRDGDVDYLMTAVSTADIALLGVNLTAQGANYLRYLGVGAGFGAPFAALPGDVDGDGDLDVVLAEDDGASVSLSWSEFGGGQALVMAEDLMPGQITAGDREVVFKLEFYHEGIPDDNAIELNEMGFRVEYVWDDPMTTAESDALIDSVDLYLDDGSGTFETISDTLVATSLAYGSGAGEYTLSFTNGDPAVTIPYTAPTASSRTYHLVIQTTDDGFLAPTTEFQIRLLEEQLRIEDAANDGLALAVWYDGYDWPSENITVTAPPDGIQVLFDESHNAQRTIDWGQAQVLSATYGGDAGWYYMAGSTDLLDPQYRFTRETVGPLDHDLLAAYDVLMLPTIDAPLTAAETTAFWRYVREGGGVVVLGSCGVDYTAYEFLYPYGMVHYTFCHFGQDFAYQGDFPISTFAAHPAVSGVPGYTTNWPGVLGVSAPATTLAETPPDVFQDRDGDGVYTDGVDVLGPFPIAAAYDEGCGRIAFLADNAFQQGYEANANLLWRLLTWVSEGQSCPVYNVMLPLVLR